MCLVGTGIFTKLKNLSHASDLVVSLVNKRYMYVYVIHVINVVGMAGTRIFALLLHLSYSYVINQVSIESCKLL